MERNVEFLCNELKVVNKQEAEDRIFFVSAKEALHQRLTESGAVTTPSESALLVNSVGKPAQVIIECNAATELVDCCQW